MQGFSTTSTSNVKACQPLWKIFVLALFGSVLCGPGIMDGFAPFEGDQFTTIRMSVDCDCPSNASLFVERTRVAVKLDPKDPDVRLQFLEALLNENRFVEAHKYLAELLLLNPDPWITNYAQGIIAAREDRRKECVEYLKSASQLNPDVGEIQMMLGSIYRKSGRLKEARDAFEKAMGCQMRKRLARSCSEETSFIWSAAD